MKTLHITSPIDSEVVENLRVGTQVLISGVMYTACALAHLRLIETLEKGEKLPFDLKGQTLYYCGPTPPGPGRVIGAAGPTTAGWKFDEYTPRLMAAGIRATIGKGNRSAEVREAIKQYRGVYLVTIGGAGALLSQTVRQAEFAAYEDLSFWYAILRLTVEDFPAIVANDVYGGDLFQEGFEPGDFQLFESHLLSIRREQNFGGF